MHLQDLYNHLAIRIIYLEHHGFWFLLESEAITAIFLFLRSKKTMTSFWPQSHRCQWCCKVPSNRLHVLQYWHVHDVYINKRIKLLLRSVSNFINHWNDFVWYFRYGSMTGVKPVSLMDCTPWREWLSQSGNLFLFLNYLWFKRYSTITRNISINVTKTVLEELSFYCKPSSVFTSGYERR